MPSRVLLRRFDLLPVSTVPDEQVRAGRAETGAWEVPVAAVDCGIWEHSVGVSTDVEAHEVFVVLEGHALIEIEGENALEVRPGDVVELAAGARAV
jgi:hypothetical protein